MKDQTVRLKGNVNGFNLMQLMHPETFVSKDKHLTLQHVIFLIMSTLGPIFLMVSTPIANILFFIICRYYDGSVIQFISTATWSSLQTHWPKIDSASINIVLVFAVFEAILLVCVPGRWHKGPVTPAGLVPEYKLNGVACYVLTWAALLLSFWSGVLPLSLVSDKFGSILLFLTCFAFLLCVLLYFKGLHFPSSADSGGSGNVIWDFYWGTELHPQILHYNLKQYCNCRLGMMGWHVLLVCFAAKQYDMYGYISSSMIASVIIQEVYIAKFFIWESGYFGSMDIQHDRFGYYICWGVLCWIAGVYTLVGHYLIFHPNQLSTIEFISIVTAGLFFTWANYDADDQRQRVRETKGKCTVWGKKPNTIKATYKTKDGVQHQTLLLVSGWWGVSRHAHYATELLLSLMWSIPAGWAIIPYFYVFYLFCLLVDRSYRDDQKCSAKYGPYWKRYCETVKYCIIPYVF